MELTENPSGYGRRGAGPTDVLTPPLLIRGRKWFRQGVHVRLIHEQSSRSKVSLSADCAAIPADLLELELSGRMRTRMQFQHWQV